ncbi:hypothetical protein D8674_008257 [Pyrus ussuriensis x Pyrus communis]|uniref:Uncharacterized protein n=1 Tax=Pyrus ussuriensis x Pyrus communis TaxID=2448454 RepID=A0A5N5HT63_9ROSA|nr:hypothetical protein D8674_008257 [Pyrus ussuriensis x Pyrus communis]
MKAGVEGQQSDEEVLSKILEELKQKELPKPSHLHLQPDLCSGKHQFLLLHLLARHLVRIWASQPVMSRVVLHQPLRATGVSGIPIPRPKKVVATKSSHSIHVEVATIAVASGGAGVMLPLLASLPAITSLPELVRKFGQIRTKLRSLRHPSEPQHLQEQHRIFKE